MKKSNKILSLVIALIFLFSAVTPALALSSEANDAAWTLKSLGVIEGYPDGSLGVDKTITRAEMTVVLSEIAAMGSAASILADIPSSFSDVKSGAWYTGYINLAAQQGWVAGYPDGTFKPNANVTYAEALTMMLNVLGYSKGELPGTWPLNYIVKATTIGVADDVTFSSGAPALRGDVFVFAVNALNTEKVTWSSDESEFILGALLIDGLAAGSTAKAQVEDAYMMVGSSLDDDDREVSIDGDVYSVAEGFDIRPFVGIPAEFYLNSDDEIIAVKTSDADDVEVADAVEFDTCCMDTFYVDDDDDTEYDIDEDAIIVVNESVYEAWEWDEHFYPATVNFILDKDDYVIYAEFVDYTEMDNGLVSDVDVDGDEVTIEFYAGDEDDVTVDVEDDYILVMGAIDDLADLEEYDVLYWNADPDDYAFYVVRDSVTGDADRFLNDDYIRVDGTKYYDGYEGAYYSLDNGDSFGSGEFEDFSEEEVTLYLDGYGDIYAIAGDVDPTADMVALAIGDVVYNTAFGTTEYRIDLFLASGEEATYYFDSDLIPSTSVGVYAGRLVEYGLNDDGEIDEFELYSSYDYDPFSEFDEDDTVDYNRIVAGMGTKYYAVSDTVIFYAEDLDDVSLWTWADVQDAGNVEVSGWVYGDDDYDITYMVITSDLTGTDDDYAVATDFWFVGSKDYVGYVTLDGYAEKEVGDFDFKTEDAAYIIVDNGSTVDLDRLSPDVDNWILAKDAYNSSRSTILVSGTEWDVDADTLIVDVTGSSPVVISVTDLAKDDVIDVYVTDSYVNVIVVVD